MFFLYFSARRFLKGSVYQVPYTESLCLFVLGSLQVSVVSWVSLVSWESTAKGVVSWESKSVILNFFANCFCSDLWLR